MNRKLLTILLIGASLFAWTLPYLAEARRGGGGGFRGGAGSFGSIRNSVRPSTRDFSRSSQSDAARPSTGEISRPPQGQVPDRQPSQQPAPGSDRLDQKPQPSQLPAAGSSARPAQQPADQRDTLRHRAEDLTPEQKDQLRQKYENSGLKPSQLPAGDREDWQDEREEIREDWQDWYDDRYDDYWDDHWHAHWWFGYPVSTVSYSFYIDDAPPCQKTVVINQAGGSTTYFYCSSIWYQPVYASGEVKYVIASPPAGAELSSLPDAYTLTVDGQEFFVSNHVFYQKITRDGQTLYVVVDAPPGAMVPTIPEYAVEIEHQGQTYYRFDRIFYQRQEDFFVVVENPGV